MPKRIKIILSESQEEELKKTRDSHPKPYMRERASAVLKVAEGEILRDVAEHQLLKYHEPETVHGWLKSYQEQGLSGWEIKPGRGRKPLFFSKK